MKKSIVEEIVLLTSLIKWTFLAILVGVIVGLSTTFFLKALGWSTAILQSQPYYFLFLPVALFLSSYLIKHLAPDAEGHGTEKVIEAVHKNWGKIKLQVVPVKLVATIITLAGGGSAGKEGPCAQIGAGMASGIADLLKLDKTDRKKIVICGISAGFATVFGTPIAGALFAVEVLILGKIMHEMLFPALVAAVIGFHISKFFGINYLQHPVIVSGFSRELFIKVLISGVFFGMVSLLLVESLKLAEKLARRLPFSKPARGLIGGSILVGLTFCLSPLYLGLGTDTIKRVLDGGTAPAGAFLWKILFTVITLSMGGSGGIVTPIFFIGSTSGSFFAHLFNLDPVIFASIGMAALLAGAANTPIAASVMAIEIFGPQIGSYAAIACAISFIAAGHRSVYSSQILGITKSASISTSLMKDFNHLDELTIKNQSGKIFSFINKFLKKQ